MDIFLAIFGTVVLYLGVRVFSEIKRKDRELSYVKIEGEVEKEILRKRRIDALYGRNKND